MHAVAAKAVGLGENLQPSFAEYARQIIRNAQALATALAERGYHIVSGGTDNHLMLIDLRNKGLTGKAAQLALDAAGITVNKNAVPFDDKPPLITSGIRLGTPALTTRGMKEPEMSRIAAWIDEVLAAMENTDLQERVKAEIAEFGRSFPAPG
jgi:glycine hydroxymethyltransferase